MKKHIAILSFVFLFSCNAKEEKAIEETQASQTTAKDFSGNLNVSILLDLSDRIDPQKYPNPTMEYFMRDVGYIDAVAQAFASHIKGKKIKQMDDRIQMYFDPPPLNPQINAISKDLKMSFGKENVSNEGIAALQRKYAQDPVKLYRLAIKDKHYVGSDTWKFFKSKVNDCIDDQHRNILILLTDGYIYYENSIMRENNETSFLTPEFIRKNGLNTSDWSEKMTQGHFGFIKAQPDLSHLEILVLGINPSPKNPYEDDVIKAYWTKWFETMKVKRYDIRSADLPSDVEKAIDDFINGK